MNKTAHKKAARGSMKQLKSALTTQQYTGELQEYHGHHQLQAFYRRVSLTGPAGFRRTIRLTDVVPAELTASNGQSSPVLCAVLHLFERLLGDGHLRRLVTLRVYFPVERMRGANESKVVLQRQRRVHMTPNQFEFVVRPDLITLSVDVFAKCVHRAALDIENFISRSLCLPNFSEISDSLSNVQGEKQIDDEEGFPHFAVINASYFARLQGFLQQVNEGTINFPPPPDHLSEPSTHTTPDTENDKSVKAASSTSAVHPMFQPGGNWWLGNALHLRPGTRIVLVRRHSNETASWHKSPEFKSFCRPRLRRSTNKETKRLTIKWHRMSEARRSLFSEGAPNRYLTDASGCPMTGGVISSDDWDTDSVFSGATDNLRLVKTVRTRLASQRTSSAAAATFEGASCRRGGGSVGRPRTQRPKSLGVGRASAADGNKKKTTTKEWKRRRSVGSASSVAITSSSTPGRKRGRKRKCLLKALSVVSGPSSGTEEIISITKRRVGRPRKIHPTQPNKLELSKSCNKADTTTSPGSSYGSVRSTEGSLESIMSSQRVVTKRRSGKRSLEDISECTGGRNVRQKLVFPDPEGVVDDCRAKDSVTPPPQLPVLAPHVESEDDIPAAVFAEEAAVVPEDGDEIEHSNHQFPSLSVIKEEEDHCSIGPSNKEETNVLPTSSSVTTVQLPGQEMLLRVTSSSSCSSFSASSNNNNNSSSQTTNCSVELTEEHKLESVDRASPGSVSTAEASRPMETLLDKGVDFERTSLERQLSDIVDSFKQEPSSSIVENSLNLCFPTSTMDRVLPPLFPGEWKLPPRPEESHICRCRVLCLPPSIWRPRPPHTVAPSDLDQPCCPGLHRSPHPCGVLPTSQQALQLPPPPTSNSPPTTFNSNNISVIKTLSTSPQPPPLKATVRQLPAPPPLHHHNLPVQATPPPHGNNYHPPSNWFHHQQQTLAQLYPGLALAGLPSHAAPPHMPFSLPHPGVHMPSGPALHHPSAAAVSSLFGWPYSV